MISCYMTRAIASGVLVCFPNLAYGTDAVSSLDRAGLAARCWAAEETCILRYQSMPGLKFRIYWCTRVNARVSSGNASAVGYTNISIHELHE